MEQKNLISIANLTFTVKGEKLYDVQTKSEEKTLSYKYVRNYLDDNTCYIIIQNRFFVWDKVQGSAEEKRVNILCQNKYMTYYVTEGDINIVFGVKDNNIFVIGRSFRPIYDNLYKIGRYAYQIVDGDLEKLCECCEFEKIDIRVEISAGENGISEMQAFQKNGKRWEKVNHWVPGNIIPQHITSRVTDIPQKTKSKTKSKK